MILTRGFEKYDVKTSQIEKVLNNKFIHVNIKLTIVY